jgi:hypothetical protein
VAATNAVVNDKVAALFRSHAVSFIHFSLENLQINPANLRKVGDAITKGTIGVSIGDTGPMLSAAYSQRAKTMALRKESETDYPEGQAAIVHEGVHAWADLANRRSGLSEEAAAYLTEVVYLQAVHRRIKGHPIYDAANELASARGLFERRGVHLTAADCESLRQAIHAEPAYQDLQ